MVLVPPSISLLGPNIHLPNFKNNGAFASWVTILNNADSS